MEQRSWTTLAAEMASAKDLATTHLGVAENVELKLSPDPMVKGVWVVRAGVPIRGTRSREVIDLLIDLRDSSVEEVELAAWPPGARL